MFIFVVCALCIFFNIKIIESLCKLCAIVCIMCVYCVSCVSFVSFGNVYVSVAAIFYYS